MRFDHISVEQGLSNFTPVIISQDKLGFLWIGTEDGLNRYDGNSFRIYRPKAADSSSLDGGIVVGLLSDRDGDLWITSQGDGFFRYDRQSDAFQKFRIPHTLKKARFVSGGLLQTRDGLIWILSNDGVFVFDKQSQRMQRVLHTSTHPSLPTNSMSCIAEDGNGGLWIGTDQGAAHFDPLTNVLKTYPFTDLLRKKPDYRSVSGLKVDKLGTVWAATIGGLLRLNRATDKFEPVQFRLRNGHPAGENIMLSLYVDSRGKVWAGTMGDGLIEHDPVTGTYRQHLHEDGYQYALLNDRITTIFEDRSGVLWVGNYRAGLNRFIQRQGQFVIYRMDSFVYSILEEPDGELWFGSTDGLYRVKHANASPVLYTDKSKTEFHISDIHVEALTRDSLGDIWIGHGTGVDRLSKRSNTIRRYPIKRFASAPTLGRTVKALAVDSEGQIWAGIDQGTLCIYDRKHDSFREFLPRRSGSVDPHVPSVWSIYEDQDRRMWFATFGAGLYCYDRKTDSLTQYLSKAGDSTTIVQNALYFVRASRDGFLWVGTFGSGVVRFDRKTGLFKTFTVADGLPDNFVKGMLEDGRGNLWFSTDKGLSRFDPNSGSFKNYREKDGLHTNVFLSGAYYAGPTGRFYFGGENGLTSFVPGRIKENFFAPSVAITSVKVFDKPVAPLGGLPADSVVTIELAHSENFFSFEFASFDFTSPDKNQFAYMLEGLDKDWIQAGTRRYASYTYVPTGEFMFKVRGTNSDGVWSPRIASARVIVTPPFWGTWWFRIFAVVLIFGVGAALYNYRVNRLLEIERLRVRIASDLHDDVGASLTRISLLSDLIQEGIEPDEKQNYLRNIAGMSRELVTSMSDIVWSIDSRNDTIENLIDKMRNFGITVLSAKDISFNLAYSGLDEKKKLSVDIRENLYLIFKEAVNNIAKHAGASRVSVVLRNDSDNFRMIIVDDGKGWGGDERLSGHGMKNMKMRAGRLKATIGFVVDDGTRVVLTMKRI